MCSDLIPLINTENPENDVFLCIIDLKQKTRSKGLKLLTKTFESIAEEKTPRITVTNLRTVLLPILFAYIREFNRNQGIIEENEVLVRGEWKSPLEEDEEGEEEEVVMDNVPTCHYCGKPNVTYLC